MDLNIKPMELDAAVQISKWIYGEPYSLYSMDGSNDCINELMDGYYYSAVDKGNNLIGYYCFGEAAKVPAGNKFGVYDKVNYTDIGLGIKPDMCGNKIGFDFLTAGLDFAARELGAKGFRLTVAAFNKRAIKVYERLGFKRVNSFKRISENGEMEFWVMTKDSSKYRG